MVPVNHQSELERLFHQNRVSQNCLVGFFSTAVASRDRLQIIVVTHGHAIVMVSLIAENEWEPENQNSDTQPRMSESTSNLVTHSELPTSV